jgi:hypothetical protein
MAKYYSTDCLEFQGYRNKQGYGRAWVKGPSGWRRWMAHRAVWVAAYGPVPEGLFVLHHCDNPACIRLDHLFLGTQKENMRDMVLKGRQATGDRHPSRLYPDKLHRGDAHWSHKHPEKLARGKASGAHTHPERRARGEAITIGKLTERKVIEMRRMHAEGLSYSEIGRRFGVTNANARKAIIGVTWAHVKSELHTTTSVSSVSLPQQTMGVLGLPPKSGKDGSLNS